MCHLVDFVFFKYHSDAWSNKHQILSISLGISRPLRYAKVHCCVFITKLVVVICYIDTVRTFKFSLFDMKVMLILYQLLRYTTRHQV